MKSDINDIKRFVKWGDQEAKNRLIEKKLLIPLPDHFFSCHELTCWRCDIKVFGIIQTIHLRVLRFFGRLK